MSSTDPQDVAIAYGQVIARAWRDAKFKARLLADPAAVLRDAGLEIPPGVTVSVVEDTNSEIHFVLPPAPAEAIADADLDGISGGYWKMYHRA